MKRHDFCDGKCNECDAPNNRQLTVILNALHSLYGDDVYHVVQHFCPNLTCCADCRIDDFTHFEGCELAKAGEEYARGMDVDVKVPEPIDSVIEELRNYGKSAMDGGLVPKGSDIVYYADKSELAAKRAHSEAYMRGVKEGKKYMLDRIRQGISKVAKDEITPE